MYKIIEIHPIKSKPGLVLAFLDNRPSYSELDNCRSIRIDDDVLDYHLLMPPGDFRSISFVTDKHADDLIGKRIEFV